MKKLLLIFVLFVCACGLTSCNSKNENTNQLNIVTSFYPMYIATSNIIDGAQNVSLYCLASPTVGCLHDYQLTVNDMITLESADVFVVNGGGMESFLDKAVSTYPNLKIINASEKEENNSLEENAHYWVSISLYIKEVENISNYLQEIDSDNAEIYEKNTNEYILRLEELKNEMHNKLDNIENKNIVTFHEAFEYFADEFGLNVVAVIEREPGTSPSAKDVAEIIDTIRELDVNAVFVEPQYLKTAANTIANETNIPVYELDPAVSGELNKTAYEDIMRNNLEVLLEALS